MRHAVNRAAGLGTVTDLGNGKTRFIIRSRLRTGPWWAAGAYLLAVIPADFVMSRQMLHGVKVRGRASRKR